MQANRLGLGVTLTLHALAAAALLSYEPARKALLATAPIMVDLIVPPKVEPQKVEPPKPPPSVFPRPKPAAQKPVERPVEPQLLAVPAEAPSPVAVAAPPAQAAAEIGTPGGPPGAMSQPIFNADYLDNPAPPYPSSSRRVGEQGRVMLRVLVNVRGTADEVQVRTSSGFARLDESARDTVRRWRFVPAKRGAEPVAAWVLIPISFRLEG